MDFELQKLVMVASSVLDDLKNADDAKPGIRLEALAVTVGMDQGDWCAAWTKALALSLKSENMTFKLEDLMLTLHPSQQHLLAGRDRGGDAAGQAAVKTEQDALSASAQLLGLDINFEINLEPQARPEHSACWRWRR